MSDRTLPAEGDKPQPYTQDENGWVWRGSMVVYPFRVNQSILDALNYAYGHGYADAMTQAESQAKAARAMGEALREVLDNMGCGCCAGKGLADAMAKADAALDAAGL